MSAIVRCLVLAAVAGVMVMATGEWTEDAEDLGKFFKYNYVTQNHHRNTNA